MKARLAASASMLACVVLLAPASARAGDLTGSVVLNKKKQEPAERSRGFIKRRPNPIMEARRFDPRSNMVVVLERSDSSLSAADKEPNRSGVKWNLLGESFDIPLLPVVVGTEIDLKNTGHSSPALYCPQRADLVKSAPISPGGVRTIAVEQAGIAYEIRAKHASHLVGRVVAFPHRFFARLDSGGRFTIKNVPAGSWKARIWYKNGYLPGVESRVTMGRRSTKAAPIRLPIVDQTVAKTTTKTTTKKTATKSNAESAKPAAGAK